MWNENNEFCLLLDKFNYAGVDNTVSCFGGAICFKKGEELQYLKKLPAACRISITNTRVPRSTKSLVAGTAEIGCLPAACCCFHLRFVVFFVFCFHENE